MPNKLADTKQRISSSQDKKLIERVQLIAESEGISFTEALKRALEKLVADYENEKQTRKKG